MVKIWKDGVLIDNEGCTALPVVSPHDSSCKEISFTKVLNPLKNSKDRVLEAEALLAERASWDAEDMET